MINKNEKVAAWGKVIGRRFIEKLYFLKALNSFDVWRVQIQEVLIGPDHFAFHEVYKSLINYGISSRSRVFTGEVPISPIRTSAS